MSAPGKVDSSTAPLIAVGLYSYQIGGSERVGVDLAFEYRARGYRVVCFAFYDSDGPFRSMLESAGIECVDLNYKSRRRAIRRISYQLEFFNFLRSRKVHSLHVHHATALILCGIAARMAGVKYVVMTEHAIHQLVERPDYRRSASRYCRYASAITAVHSRIAAYFVDDMGVDPSRVVVVANGVRLQLPNTTVRAVVRGQLGIPTGDVAIFFIGRLELVKNLETLLLAASFLAKTCTQSWRLFVVGDGSQRDRLHALCGQLDLVEKVQFLGVRSDVSNLLTAADIFVMTSLTEGLPMALIEAMAAGVPCVSTDVGGIADLFAGEAGLVVPVGDSEAVGGALAQLMRSPELRDSIAQRARRVIEARYSLGPVVTQYLTLLGLKPRNEN